MNHKIHLNENDMLTFRIGQVQFYILFSTKSAIIFSFDIYESFLITSYETNQLKARNIAKHYDFFSFNFETFIIPENIIRVAVKFALIH